MIFDPWYFIFILPGLLLSMWAQSKVKGNFQKYSQVRNGAGLTGAQTSRRILDNEGLQSIPVEQVQGALTDHYDPRSKVLRLSQPVYGVDSVAAMAVAAHEAGHALQQKDGYSALKFRSAIVPLANIGSQLGFLLLFLGIIIGISGLSWAGVGLFAMSTLFALVTLPVEFNASRRAKTELNQLGLTGPDDAAAVDKVLDAAAWTYVAGFLSSLLSLLYFIRIANRGR
ncbi:MAG: zinc metallopeptidase [Thermomicrobiales bacterium]|nr:zinc metallopeptidase [Thermomicrobiales bacterium]MCO5221918.1 zinc metallopeptidase [Thermomicrobiales bacterium]